MLAPCEPFPLPLRPQTYQRVYLCRCGNQTFFRNSVCVNCSAPLGYEPLIGKLLPLTPGPAPSTWLLDCAESGSSNILYRSCANLTSACGCNWLVRDEDGETLCISCRLNRYIPDLSDPVRAEGWNKIELAKRRLISSLLALGLPVGPPLTFDFLATLPDGPKVTTGHSNGTITLNIEEADDATREQNRKQLHEPYRTLLGHLRHETGHYYWDRLIAGSKWLAEFRELFGDDQQDYAAALQKHYAEGPSVGWEQKFVSAYAASHPWEDWAETWAHYLHMEDTLATAASFRLDINSVEVRVAPFETDVADEEFLAFIHNWVRLTAVLNELSRSMGLQDFYPFVLSRASVAKLHFVHRVMRDRSTAQ
ncbi:hypothetical protein F183_A40490 [Bryobacterales bacterium F-183]|nr:hypothetical protein F183_A40490 [Bryobacterales bacterium F-183]